MSYLRFFWVPLLAASVLLLKTAFGQQSPPASPPASPALAEAPAEPPPKEDAAAAETMRKAADQFDLVKHPRWVHTELWQKVNVQGLAYEAKGRYLVGPNYRVRLDLKLLLAGSEGKLAVVSDGGTVWQSMQAGAVEPHVTRWDIKKILETLNAPGMKPQLRDEFFQGQFFAGLAPLMRGLHQQLTFTNQQKRSWQGKDVLELTGIWKPEVAKTIAPPGPWPPFFARTARLYLDAQTLWPYRVEWRGPVPGQGDDVVLLQMEFREPRFLDASAAPPPEFTKAFQFDPGKASAEDLTAMLAEALKARSQQMGVEKPPASK